VISNRKGGVNEDKSDGIWAYKKQEKSSKKTLSTKVDIYSKW